MRRTRWFAAREGLSLIEVLVVLFLLALLMVPAITLFTGQSKQASQSIFILNAHAHLLRLLREAESRLHAERFQIDDESVEVAQQVTTSWGHVLVCCDEWVRCSRSPLTRGAVVVEAGVSWDESRGTHVKRMSHRLSHVLCDPSVGQELDE